MPGATRLLVTVAGVVAATARADVHGEALGRRTQEETDPGSSAAHATFAPDGRAATVHIRHGGRSFDIPVSAASVLADDAQVLAHTSRGTERLELPPLGLFRAREPGARAAAKLYPDGSVAGLFEVNGNVIRVLPNAENSSHSPSEPRHDLRYLKPWHLYQQGIVARRLSGEEALGADVAAARKLGESDGSEEFTETGCDDGFFPDIPTSLPSDEVPRPGLGIAAMEQWGGQKWYPGCYPGDSDLHQFKLGIVVDHRAFETHGDDITEHVLWIVSQSSFVMEMQMNFRLVVDYFIVYKSARGAPPFAVGCPEDVGRTVHEKLSLLNKHFDGPFNGATHILTSCGRDHGVVGVASVGTICRGASGGMAADHIPSRISNKRSPAMMSTFIHELGHNMGARHSFEDGQGKTGGIMDYGDGHLNGVFQFNTKYRKDEMCSKLTRAKPRCGGKFEPLGDPRPTVIPPNPDGCITVGYAGVGFGKKCVFPFVYKDIEYQGCSAEDHHNLWCATEVDGDGKAVDGKWGDCSWSPQCMGKDSPCLTVGDAGAGEGRECVFPFKYMGKEFKTCTWVRPKFTSGLWCATKVDTDGNMLEWGECDKTGYCRNHWKTVGWAGIPQNTINSLGNQAWYHVRKGANSLYDNTIGRVVGFFRWLYDNTIGRIVSLFRGDAGGGGSTAVLGGVVEEYEVYHEASGGAPTSTRWATFGGAWLLCCSAAALGFWRLARLRRHPAGFRMLGSGGVAGMDVESPCIE